MFTGLRWHSCDWFLCKVRAKYSNITRVKGLFCYATFPRSQPGTMYMFPALAAGHMFSRAWRSLHLSRAFCRLHASLCLLLITCFTACCRLHVFPHLPLVTCFPALPAVLWLPAPHLPLAKCFPALALITCFTAVGMVLD